MSLLAALGNVLGGRSASFQLMGEDLWAVNPAAFHRAGLAYEKALKRIPSSLRASFEREQSVILKAAHAWNRKYNRSMYRRVAGYLALGRACGFEYPWPVVAVLGICQVISGNSQSYIYGVAGQIGRRYGLTLLEQYVDGIQDVLRRTNRGIFADSVPTVLLALHAHNLRRQGDHKLASALLNGPLHPLMDEENRTIASRLFDSLAIEDGQKRFRALADLTLRHFSREQHIFSYHMGAKLPEKGRKEPLWTRLFSEVRAVPAPVVSRSWRGRRIEFKPYRLPKGYDMRDHDLRVREFGRAFVVSLTSNPDDYRTAVRYAVRRFEGHSAQANLNYPKGGMPNAVFS